MLKKWFQFSWWVMVAMVLGTSGVFAQSTYQSQFANETPTWDRKARNLGMGNVGVAIKGTHSSAPNYNPAGLNDLEEGKFEFFAPTFEISKNSFGSISQFKTLTDDLDNAADASERVDVFDDFIQDNAGEFRRIRVALELIKYARKNFAAGLLFDNRFDNSFRNLSFPNFQVQNLGDVMAYASGSYDFWDKLLQIGVTFRPVVRFSLDQDDQVVTYADVVAENADGDPVLFDKLKKIKDPKFGFGVDLGVKSYLNVPGVRDWKSFKLLKPAIGVTWQDVGGSTFSTKPGNEQSINVGLAIHPDIWKLKNTIGMDFRALNQDRNFLSKFHFGVESEFPWWFSLRLGANQGYFTAGATGDFKYVRLDLAYFHEELGAKTREQGSPRFIFTLAFVI